jgi:hypothetical protein
MSLSRKFAKFAGAGLLGLTILAGAGCQQAPQSPAQQQAAAEKAQGIYADRCVVVEAGAGLPKDASSWSSAAIYDFRNGVFVEGGYSDGSLSRSAVAVPISQLNEGGKAHALEMYNKLPATAKCEAPKLGPQ